MSRNVSNGHTNLSNVVGIVKISDRLDLDMLYREMENTSYEPEQFSGLTFRSEDPTGTVVLFNSGKAICTGAKNERDLEAIILGLVHRLGSLGVPVFDEYDIQIKNMVFTRTLEKPINLAKVALDFGLENVDYEPEEFPGLIFKIEKPSSTFILFESGKIICTGSGSIEEAEHAFRILERKLKRFEII